MLGNILSAVVWIHSTTFASYIMSRVIGGLSEGNVQLAVAILSDVTSAADRSKALASVGIAFAICFCIGPPIGAYFASRPFPPNIVQGLELNIYATPAALTVVLLVLETIFLAVALPETRFSRENEGKSEEIDLGDNVAPSPGPSRSVQLRGKSVQDRLQLLKSMSTLHFLFLGIFSGVEFTLTFLTFDRECPIFSPSPPHVNRRLSAPWYPSLSYLSVPEIGVSPFGFCIGHDTLAHQLWTKICCWYGIMMVVF